MKTLNFNPVGKVFLFKLDKSTCYRIKTGAKKCLLDDMSIDDILNTDIIDTVSTENSELYCIELAQKLLKSMLPAPVTINYNSICKHYSFTDGQHRTCIVSRLLKKTKNVDFSANIAEQNCKCRYCLIKENICGDLYSNQWSFNKLVSKIKLNLSTKWDEYKKDEFLLKL